MFRAGFKRTSSINLEHYERICEKIHAGRGNTSDGVLIYFLQTFKVVRFPCFCWGGGTAIGELPPYFIAKSARILGSDTQSYTTKMNSKTIREKLEKLLHTMVTKFRFMGILVAASIPNPLFDLAGITCGHFGVPFWTFFGATLIGKAVIKVHIQMLFIITVFSEAYLAKILSFIQVKLNTSNILFFPFLRKSQ